MSSSYSSVALLETNCRNQLSQQPFSPVSPGRYHDPLTLSLTPQLTRLTPPTRLTNLCSQFEYWVPDGWKM